MKIRIVKMVLVSLAFVIMGAALWIVRAPAIRDIMAAAYLASVGAFLGIDIVAMIKTSSVKSVGEFETINVYKYITCFVEMGILTGIAFYQKQILEIPLTIAVGFLGAGCIIIVGIALSGLEANKVATLKDGADGC